MTRTNKQKIGDKAERIAYERLKYFRGNREVEIMSKNNKGFDLRSRRKVGPFSKLKKKGKWTYHEVKSNSSNLTKSQRTCRDQSRKERRGFSLMRLFPWKD